MAERSKSLVLGTSHFDGVGSNPTAANCVFFIKYCLPSSELRPKIRELKHEYLIGSVAERSKAMVLGTSHFDGVGSNPTAANVPFWNFVYLPLNRGPKVRN